MFKFMIEGAKDNLDEKLKSPFWGSMIATWLTWNWKVWYVTIFISHEHLGTGLNKIDYIKEISNWINLFNSISCNKFIPVIETYNLQNLFIFSGIIFHWIIMPLFLSWGILIFVTPKISIWFKKKHRDNKIEENKIKIEEIESKTDVLNAQEKVKNKELAFLKQQEEMQKVIENLKKDAKLSNQNNKTEEEKWDEDYIKFSKNYNDILSELPKLIYIHHGYFNIRYKLGAVYKVGYNGSKAIPILHAFELIIMDKEIDAKYLLTTKGKYFLKKASLAAE